MALQNPKTHPPENIMNKGVKGNVALEILGFIVLWGHYHNTGINT
jgi:hypothetical protein